MGATAASVLACTAGDGSQFGSGSGGDGANSGAGAEGGGLLATSTGTGGGSTGDPKTCEDAANAKSYLGCDFWPTVVPNQVWSIFDYAVVVANAGSESVQVTVERGGVTVDTATIPPDSLEKMYLPWVPELKGPDFDEFTAVVPFTNSVKVAGGAYHLTTDRPVTVYQFSALEYAPQGGPPGKSWAGCPGDLSGVGCFSYSNDASLLLPSTALTGSYRLTGTPGWVQANLGGYMAVTAVQDQTNVTVQLSATGQVMAGTGVTAIAPGGTGNLSLNKGDVAILLGSATGDQSGTLIDSGTTPVQVIHGVSCIFIPEGQQACDHIEESVFPAETLGTHYFVARPVGPAGDAVSHVVKMYGNFDGTTLEYPSGAPPGAPTTLNAGQVVNLDIVAMDFEVSGSQSFGVGTFLMSAQLVDPNNPPDQQRGDPAQSIATAVEQYRGKYVFLAPNDYSVNYMQVVQPMDATLTLDGVAVTVAPVAIGTAGFGVARVPLTSNTGAHVLEASAPVGIQVMGYGSYTSYYYPGGSDLEAISPTPPLE